MPFESKLFRFWCEKEKWPWAVGHTFLAQVVNALGNNMFEGAWSRLDPAGMSAGGNARFAAVKRQIAVTAAEGRLITALQWKTGGDLKPMAPHLWQTTNEMRFRFCQIDLADPFPSNRYKDTGNFNIFVTDSSLATFLEPAEPAQKKRGPQPTFPWASFEEEAMRRLTDAGGINIDVDWTFRKQTLLTEMMQWCSDQAEDERWPRAPSEPMARQRLNKVIENYEKTISRRK